MPNLGMSGPQQVLGGQPSSSSWYDSNALAALLARTPAGADGRRVLNHGEMLGLLTPQTGFQQMNTGGVNPSNSTTGMGTDTPYSPTWQGRDGQMYSETGRDAQGNANVQLQTSGNDGYQNPTGSNHDRMSPSYRVDAQGNATPTGTGEQYTPSGWVDYGRQMAELAAVMGTVGFGGAALAGAGGLEGAGGAAASAGGGGGIGADSLAYGALENGAAYGGGAGSALTASSEAGLGGALGTAEGGAGALGAGAGYTTPGLGAMGGGGAAGGAAGGGGALFGANGLMGTGVSATDLAGYAGSALRFAGSPAGGALLGAAGGLLGAGHGLNSSSESSQNRIDPRMGRYIYGQDGNSGLLGNVNNLYSSQLAQGGLNDLQRQGMNSQLGVLNNPAYQAGYTQMRNDGNSLMGQPIAGNPFTSGQMQIPSNMRPVGLMGK